VTVCECAESVPVLVGTETGRIYFAVDHDFAVAIMQRKVTAKIHSEIDSLRLILIIMALLPTR
jgi:hypothetical protein